LGHERLLMCGCTWFGVPNKFLTTIHGKLQRKI
jgi:hypothetical protein